MLNFYDTFSQAAFLWSSFFDNNASTAMPLRGITSYGTLGTSGFSNPTFQYSTGGKAVCVSGMLTVPVVGTTIQVGYKGPKDNYDLTEFITNFLRVDSDAISRDYGAPEPFTGTFSIYSNLCVPVDTSKAKNPASIQFLTHGGTTDISYWNFARGYSYVDAAADQGYATFSYDRLGTGKSDHPDPHQVVQAPVQVELAHVLVQKLRSAQIGNITFDHVIGVGHSLGSLLTQGLSSKYTDDLDALVLTGHSAFQGGAGTGFAASAQQIANTLPDRPDFKHLPNGYFTLGPALQTLQFAFFYYPHFDPESDRPTPFISPYSCLYAVEEAFSSGNRRLVFVKSFKARQTNAIGETLTLWSIMVPVPDYKKPVLLLNGQQDYFYCQGNCLANGDVTAQALTLFYPNAAASQSVAITLPDLGHNINLHLGCEKAFDKILGFISNLRFTK